MTGQNTQTPRFDRRIPWLVALPLVVIAAILLWGARTYSVQAEIDGEFPLPPGTETVRVIMDVGTVDARIGEAGKVKYAGRTLQVVGSSELLEKLGGYEFDLIREASSDPKVLVLRVPPLPEGFTPLPPIEGQPAGTAPKLFRQIDVILYLSPDVGLEIVARQSNIRVDTRQAATRVENGSGSVLVMHTTGDLFVRSGDGKLIINQHRGPMDVECRGKSHVSVSELVGPIRIDNALGELDLTLPKHASFDLDAFSETGKVVNAFGLEPQDEGRGTRVRGKVGAGEQRVELVNRQGTLTLRVPR